MSDVHIHLTYTVDGDDDEQLYDIYSSACLTFCVRDRINNITRPEFPVFTQQ